MAGGAGVVHYPKNCNKSQCTVYSSSSASVRYDRDHNAKCILLILFNYVIV